MRANPKHYTNLILCAALIVVTLAVYWPVRNHEFIDLDDDAYIVSNPNVKSGLSWQGVKWAFTTGHAANWHPVTWLSHQFDCQFFDLKPAAHHLINLLFHIINTILVFLVFNRMTKGVWQSAFIAGLFALHPLHVESVAWVAERKDMLSTMFWLLTMFAYVRYAERNSISRYFIALVLFILGLMSKPMLVTLPIVLLLLDYWPLERLQKSKSSIFSLIIEKIPFFVLSIISSVITFMVQQHSQATSVILPLEVCLANAINSYAVYIGKMIWPIHLAVLYPHIYGFIPVFKIIVFAVMLIVATIVLIYYGRRHKYLIVGWFWYIVTLVPVIGIIQVGSQAMADRYTYIPLTGIFLIIAFGASELLQNIPVKKYIFTALAIIVLLGCVTTTSKQLKYWQDDYPLYDHALTVIEQTYLTQDNVSELGPRRHTSEALRYVPNSPVLHTIFGTTLLELNRLDEAIDNFKFAIELDPNYLTPYYNMAIALGQKGDVNGAIEQYKSIIRLKPDFVDAYSFTGELLYQKGQFAESIEYLEKAIQFAPDNIPLHNRLMTAYASIGKIDEAIEHCRIVLKANPNDAEMLTNLGILLQVQGRVDEAIESYRKALQINPNFQKARENLETILAQKQAGK
jgi:protein O-mannosyl-transferase